MDSSFLLKGAEIQTSVILVSSLSTTAEPAVAPTFIFSV